MVSEIFPNPSKGCKVLGAMYGGLGDCLMIANTCSPICDFTLCAQEFQRPLLERVVGCKTQSLEFFKDFNNKNKFDSCVNFMYFLTSGAALKTGGYYSILEKKIRQVSPLAGFDFKAEPKSGIFIHTQASNPNRDWTRDKWEETVTKLSEIDTVYVLGRKADFTPKSGNVVPLWQESENLVFQAEKLASARYFIGVDSSFCHIAGMLGTPGSVLFFNTKASDVISRYPSLEGIDAFNGLEPSRSLRPDCKLSNKFKDGLSVQAVVDAVAARLCNPVS